MICSHLRGDFVRSAIAETLESVEENGFIVVAIKKKNYLTKRIAINESNGMANPTRAAFRHVVTDPRKNMAKIPIIVLMLVTTRRMPRMEG